MDNIWKHIDGREPTFLASETFRRRLREARDARGWSRARLADRVQFVGGTLTEKAILRLEAPGETNPQEVKLNDLIELALALSVAPLDLIIPTGLNEDFDLTPGREESDEDFAEGLSAPTAAAWEWFVGNRPLPAADTDPDDEDFYLSFNIRAQTSNGIDDDILSAYMRDAHRARQELGRALRGIQQELERRKGGR